MTFDYDYDCDKVSDLFASLASELPTLGNSRQIGRPDHHWA